MPAEVAKPTRSTSLPQDVAQRSGAAGQIGRRLVTLSWAVFDRRKRGKTPAQYEPLKAHQGAAGASPPVRLQGRSALSFITDSVRYWLGQAVALA